MRALCHSPVSALAPLGAGQRLARAGCAHGAARLAATAGEHTLEPKPNAGGSGGSGGSAGGLSFYRRAGSGQDLTPVKSRNEGFDRRLTQFCAEFNPGEARLGGGDGQAVGRQGGGGDCFELLRESRLGWFRGHSTIHPQVLFE